MKVLRSMRRDLKVFKNYAIKRGVRELRYLNGEDGETTDRFNVFFFQYDDIEGLLKGFIDEKKKDIFRCTRELPGTRFRAWSTSIGVKIASLEADEKFTNYLNRQKTSGVSTYMPSGRNSLPV